MKKLLILVLLCLIGCTPKPKCDSKEVIDLVLKSNINTVKSLLLKIQYVSLLHVPIERMTGINYEHYRELISGSDRAIQYYINMVDFIYQNTNPTLTNITGVNLDKKCNCKADLTIEDYSLPISYTVEIDSAGKILVDTVLPTYY